VHPACPAAQRALYSTFYGNKLFTLRPNPRKEDVIDLLQASPRLCRRPLLGWLAGWLAGYAAACVWQGEEGVLLQAQQQHCQPPAASRQPPAASRQPPAASRQPPAASRQPPPRPPATKTTSHLHHCRVQVMELTLPEDIERMKSSRKREEVVVERLAIQEQPLSVSSSAIELAWRPPSHRAERVERCAAARRCCSQLPDKPAVRVPRCSLLSAGCRLCRPAATS
jgi:hypothetical protein